MDLKANSLRIALADSPQEAPIYRPPEYRAANIVRAVVVGRGTQRGLATIDFVFEDENGQKYVAMLTAGIVDNLAAAGRGMNERVRLQDAGQMPRDPSSGGAPQ